MLQPGRLEESCMPSLPGVRQCGVLAVPCCTKLFYLVESSYMAVLLRSVP